MPRKSSKSNVKVQDFTATVEQKKQAIQDEMSFLEETLGTQINKTSQTTAKKKKNSTVLEGEPELDIAEIKGRQYADKAYRPNGGWKADTVYKRLPSQ